MVIVRYFAGARAAAGTSEEKVDAASLAHLVDDLSGRHGERLGKVLAISSYLVDGVAWHDREAVLPDGVTVDVLPPFAGG